MAGIRLMKRTQHRELADATGVKIVFADQSLAARRRRKLQRPAPDHPAGASKNTRYGRAGAVE